MITITGVSRVIDGDTVVVAGVHVRLKGVDAAELGSPLGENKFTLTRATGRHNERGRQTEAASIQQSKLN
jgi:endonuclease YncB( thermonuclease family)